MEVGVRRGQEYNVALLHVLRRGTRSIVVKGTDFRWLDGPRIRYAVSLALLTVEPHQRPRRDQASVTRDADEAYYFRPVVERRRGCDSLYDRRQHGDQKKKGYTQTLVR